MNLSDEIIKCKLEGFHAEYERISRHNNQLIDQKTLLVEECRVKKLALNAYKSTQNIFCEKIEMLKRLVYAF